ncbi:uncharacterized protein BX663DRAFT_507218 [Cokeromyces recurvatus]|uniref:uncharacterized protein n=1 Tax=Cokeromyces recurvatus TaxID=90255 RepID=UPI0022207540|nr:uncharacterized protein BX663DRAFT_507218 [Cokeromyces recurvatus]KAI7903653.1 hypothetical protein BX663DRAFT_507218 [Cokeromyces recurvatus]
MPMQKDLQKIHKDIQEIMHECKSLRRGKYSSEDIQHLQEKLHNIDTQYKEGIIDDRNKEDINDDPYEHEGQAQVANDLAKAHQKLSEMLSQVSQ